MISRRMPILIAAGGLATLLLVYALGGVGADRKSSDRDRDVTAEGNPQQIGPDASNGGSGDPLKPKKGDVHDGNSEPTTGGSWPKCVQELEDDKRQELLSLLKVVRNLQLKPGDREEAARKILLLARLSCENARDLASWLLKQAPDLAPRLLAMFFAVKVPESVTLMSSVVPVAPIA